MDARTSPSRPVAQHGYPSHGHLTGTHDQADTRENAPADRIRTSWKWGMKLAPYFTFGGHAR